jgi:hypothetical protein
VLIRRKLAVRGNFRRQTNRQRRKTAPKGQILGLIYEASTIGANLPRHHQNHEKSERYLGPLSGHQFFDNFYHNDFVFASKGVETNDVASGN